MQARTAAFDAAIISGGNVVTTADVQRGGEVVLANVPLSAGEVSVDGTASVRRSITVTVPDEFGTLRPIAGGSPLAPYGSELVVRQGFRYVSGAVEQVPLGVFRLTDSETFHDGSIGLSGVDRAAVVADNRWETPYVIAAGTNLATAIKDLIGSRLAGLTYNFATTTRTTPLTVYEEGDRSGDPWSNAQDLARAGGMEVFFDALGGVVLRPVPDPAVDPVVWEYLPGANSIQLAASNRLSTGDARNVAVVTGEGTGVATPLRSVAVLTDPLNPLNVNAFGRRPVFLTSPLITSQAQADEAARALLLRRAGGSEQLRFSAVGHPAHEAGDVVRVVNERAGLDDFAVLSRFRLPLDLLSAVAYETRGRRSAT